MLTLNNSTTQQRVALLVLFVLCSLLSDTFFFLFWRLLAHSKTSCRVQHFPFSESQPTAVVLVLITVLVLLPLHLLLLVLQFLLLLQ